MGILALMLTACEPEQPLVPLPPAKLNTNAPPINLVAEIDRANREKKTLVLQFTGSDWCFACALMDKEVFSQPAFQDYARSNLVWVEVDIPQRTKVPITLLQTNIALAQKFNVENFPSTIVLDKDGKEVWRLAGYVPGGPMPLIRKLEIRRQDLLRPK